MTCYLIDLDGTLLVDGHAVNGAMEFVDELNRRGEEYLLITNGSAKEPEKLAQLLCEAGIAIAKERIITSAEASAEYIKKYHAKKSVYCMGSIWLRQCLTNVKIELSDQTADVVLIGYDETISMTSINQAIDLIRSGAVYLSTNDDIWIPSGNAVKPHTGCINEILHQATGKTALVIGKPEEYFMEMIRQRTCAETFCMIGDSRKTDGEFGIRNNMKVYIVESNVTRREKNMPYDGICKIKDLREIIQYI